MEKKLNNITSYFFIAFAFIIPLIFSASAFFSFQFTKIIPFFVVLFVATFVYIIKIFNDGKVEIPLHGVFIAILSVPLLYIISAIFSIDRVGSFLGSGSEIGTASMIGAFFLFMYFVSFFLRSKENVFMAYLAFGAAFLLLAFFHILRFFFGADFLSFDIFTSVISNTVGRFSDLSILSGIAVLLSLTSIEFLRLGKLFKTLCYVALGLSLIVLAVTNFPIIVWGVGVANSLSLMSVIGVFALVFFVYFVSSSYRKDNRTVPIASLIVLVISVLFTLGAGPLQGALSSFFKIEPTIETRLLWEPTGQLSWSTLTNRSFRPLVGYGPEQFSYKWMLDKPAEINGSMVWNTPFRYGTGFVPSSIVTVGALGFLGWVAFLGLLVWLGSKALFVKAKDPFSNYLTVSSFLVSLYLWITAIVYIPSLTTFMLTFLFTGLFLGSLFRENIIKEKSFVFDDSKKKSFVFIMSLILALMLVLFWGYKIGEHVVASVYANKANVAIQTAQSPEDIEKSKTYLRTAGSLANESYYSRILAEITLAQVNGILQDTNTPPDTLRQNFQTRYQEAIGYAQNAIARNPKSFDNYVTFGNILSVGASLNIPGYYEGAKTSYEEANKLNPKSPLIPFLLAQLEVNNKNLDGAKAKIGDALSLKPNFIDAIVFLGRIQISQGRTDDAIASFTVALSIDPTNEDIKAVLNSLRNKRTVPASSNSGTSTASSTAR